MAQPDSPLIADKDIVFLHINYSYYEQMKPKALLFTQKPNRKFTIGELIGKQYESWWDCSNGRLVPLKEPPPHMDELDDGDDAEEDIAAPADAQVTETIAPVQSLNGDDIQKLRSDGVHGEAIVKELVTHSTSFNKKTDFAKQKYVKKKKNKVCRATPAIAAEFYFRKSPERVCHLRPDSLGLLMYYGDVFCGRRVMVFETALGVVLGAALSRVGNQPGRPRDAIKCSGARTFGGNMNMKRVALDTIREICGTKKQSNTDDKHDAGVVIETESKEVEMKEPSETKEPEAKDEAQDQAQAQADVKEGDGKGDDQIENRRMMYADTFKKLASEPFDSMVIAIKYDPMEAFLELLTFLKPSGSFSIYSQHIELLSSIYMYLERNELASKLVLCDVFYRQYQVLPDRTHPVMNMDGAGGFILSGIKVLATPVTDDGTAAFESGATKKARVD